MPDSTKPGGINSEYGHSVHKAQWKIFGDWITNWIGFNKRLLLQYSLRNMGLTAENKKELTQFVCNIFLLYKQQHLGSQTFNHFLSLALFSFQDKTFDWC